MWRCEGEGAGGRVMCGGVLEGEGADERVMSGGVRRKEV